MPTASFRPSKPRCNTFPSSTAPRCTYTPVRPLNVTGMPSNQAAGDIPHLICYAVKANSNLALLNLLARLGSGFDIVSGGELSRVLAAGGDPAKVVFSGVAKSEAEMRLALDKEILCFNLESEAELERLNRVAGSMGKKARVSVRVNPDIDAGTHPYISTGLKQNKFGIPIEQAPAIYRKAAAMANIEIKGVDCHIGSQLTELNPFMEAADKLLRLIDTLAAEGIHIHHLDVGGGLGVNYGAEQPPHPTEYAEALNRSWRVGIDPAVRTGPCHRRQRRCAADPGGVPEAG